MRARVLTAIGVLTALLPAVGCETVAPVPAPGSIAALEARIAELEEANRIARLELAEEQERNNAQVFLMRQETARLQTQIASLREQCGAACTE